MNYCIYKLSFKTPVHFGKGRLNTSIYTIYADTLFSAMYKEAIMIYGEAEAKKLYDFCINGKLKISDTMPYNKNVLFIPKPILNTENQMNLKLKKKFKEIDYISLYNIDSFINGQYIPEKDDNKFGQNSIRYNVRVNRNNFNDDNEPFTIGTYTFKDNCGLYFIAMAENDDVLNMIDDIMDSLSYTGIGGRLSSGFGKFEYTYENAKNDLIKRFEGKYSKCMSLSSSMANENELENCLVDASFELIKRSGFISSSSYSDTPTKKKDFYCFKGGSCFKNKFQGNIFDVSNNINNSQKSGHSVYRYAIPMFIGLK